MDIVDYMVIGFYTLIFVTVFFLCGNDIKTINNTSKRDKDNASQGV